MDLGFEGNFIAPFKSVIRCPEWIERQLDDDWIHLKSTNFSIVFANDILKEAALIMD